MRIERAELHQVKLPLVFPFETSFGREDTKACVLVRLYAGGLEGWGEAPAAGAPLYNEETVGPDRGVPEPRLPPDQGEDQTGMGCRGRPRHPPDLWHGPATSRCELRLH